MKKTLVSALVLMIILGCLLLISCNGQSCKNGEHVDNDDNGSCDACRTNLLVVIDFYAINDLHGKFCDTDNQPGLDELATFLDNVEKTDDNVVILASGDMWQGSAESNLTGGLIVTEWMNEAGFVSMTLGNHDFDWGEDAIKENLAVAEFPFLAINVYDVETGKLAEYCTPSVMIERCGIQIGIIGAIGDCYSSISKDKVEGVEFKVGSELASLVKAESARLRAEGADVVIYSLHDGHGDSSSGEKNIGNTKLSKYYSPSLSDGAVDLVFESHTHQSYTLIDSFGVYHLQGGGENKGISHVEIAVNSVTGGNKVKEAEIIKTKAYSYLDDDDETEALEDKYSEIIEKAYSSLGSVSRYYDDTELEDKVAELYLESGLEKWGEDYDIVLGGGFLRTRYPYNLTAGSTTYAEILSLLPFDNEIVLCEVSGYDLKKRFIDSTSDDYHIYLSEYGNSLADGIENNKTYYIIVDTYTAFYDYNGLTIVEYFDFSAYARDLVAEAIKSGEL